ncbi:MAG: glutamate--cysteine ligase, partial [Gammaproteobacteria bacterium]|nr:glutamate--cysteine ligase [Gammaproteobacteria bacterium]
EYVEIRSLDINPFDPAGINQNAMRFVEAFVIYCLLQESPPLDDQASEEAARNHTQTAKNGRDPDFRLMRGGEPVSLRDWGSEIVRAVHNVAELIDRGNGGSDYRDAVDVQSGLLEDPDSTPSARLLEELNLAGTGFFDFALQAAKGHKEYFAAVEPMQQDRLKHMEQEASESLQRQRAIEKGDSLSLDEYLAAYFSRD